MKATVIEAVNVAAGHAQINAADLHISHLFSLEHRRTQIFLDLFGVDDLALAHAVRRRLADAEDVQRAVGALFADHDADF